MNFGQAIASGFRNYIGFEGRACRSEFWYWVLFTILGSIATAIIDGVIFPGNPVSPINALFGLGTLVPSIAVTIRRLHDIGKTGWWWLLVFIPIIGWIILIVWEIRRGEEGPNRFGADPLGAAAAQPL